MLLPVRQPTRRHPPRLPQTPNPLQRTHGLGTPNHHRPSRSLTFTRLRMLLCRQQHGKWAAGRWGPAFCASVDLVADCVALGGGVRWVSDSAARTGRASATPALSVSRAGDGSSVPLTWWTSRRPARRVRGRTHGDQGGLCPVANPNGQNPKETTMTHPVSPRRPDPVGVTPGSTRA